MKLLHRCSLNFKFQPFFFRCLFLFFFSFHPFDASTLPIYFTWIQHILIFSFSFLSFNRQDNFSFISIAVNCFTRFLPSSHGYLIFYFRSFVYFSIQDSVLNIDIAPTLLDLAGLHYDKEAFDGQSIVPLIKFAASTAAGTFYKETAPRAHSNTILSDSDRVMLSRCEKYWAAFNVSSPTHDDENDSIQLDNNSDDVKFIASHETSDSSIDCKMNESTVKNIPASSTLFNASVSPESTSSSLSTSFFVSSNSFGDITTTSSPSPAAAATASDGRTSDEVSSTFTSITSIQSIRCIKAKSDSDDRLSDGKRSLRHTQSLVTMRANDETPELSMNVMKERKRRRRRGRREQRRGNVARQRRVNLMKNRMNASYEASVNASRKNDDQVEVKRDEKQEEGEEEEARRSQAVGEGDAATSKLVHSADEVRRKVSSLQDDSSSTFSMSMSFIHKCTTLPCESTWPSSSSTSSSSSSIAATTTTAPSFSSSHPAAQDDEEESERQKTKARSTIEQVHDEGPPEDDRQKQQLTSRHDRQEEQKSPEDITIVTSEVFSGSTASSTSSSSTGTSAESSVSFSTDLVNECKELMERMSRQIKETKEKKKQQKQSTDSVIGYMDGWRNTFLIERG